MRVRGASGCAGERAVFMVHAECCQESVAWAVSLRAAQLLAGDSFTRRRSVAPLGASLAFGEIASERSRARPTEPARSTEQPLRPHARPQKGSHVPTHPLSSCIAARARPHPHDSRETPRSALAGLLARSRPRDLRVNHGGRLGIPLCRNRRGPLAGRPRPTGVVLAFGRRTPKACVEHLCGHSLVASRDENSEGPDCRVRQRIRSALSRAERCAFARRSGLCPT